jgi:hypothetical protein
MEEMKEMCKDKTSVIYNNPKSRDMGKEATIIKVDDPLPNTTIYDTGVLIKFNDDGRVRSTVCKYLEKKIQRNSNPGKPKSSKPKSRNSKSRNSKSRNPKLSKSKTKVGKLVNLIA